jgi:hypothetical protein
MLKLILLNKKFKFKKFKSTFCFIIKYRYKTVNSCLRNYFFLN